MGLPFPIGNVEGQKNTFWTRRKHRRDPLADGGTFGGLDSGEQMIDLGVRDMILLSNHKRTIIGLEGYGLNVVE